MLSTIKGMFIFSGFIFTMRFKVSIWTLLAVSGMIGGDDFDEEQYGVRYATDCEVCKVVTLELTRILEKSAGRHEVIETGYSVEKEKKRTKYAVSELRLVEALDSLCEGLLRYNVHKERSDWTRFAPGTSETFRALEGLVAKGVKVDIGIPQELWHKPPAEVTQLRTQCDTLLEEHEEDVEEWYFHRQAQQSLEEHLCRQKFLRGKDQACLDVKGELKDLKNSEARKKEDL